MSERSSDRRGPHMWRRQQTRFPRLTWLDEHGEFKLRILWPGWYLVRKSRRRRTEIYRRIAGPKAT